MAFATADLSDQYGDQVQVAAPVFRAFGGCVRFSGPMTTVMVQDDNSTVRDLLEEEGAGRVLVVDGGGSLHCALVGDRLGQLAQDNGWAGIVVHGCVRDAAALEEIAIGIRALATMPRRSTRQRPGVVDVPLHFAGVLFEPGHYLYADADGIVVSPVALE
jgi:regulator of ribonuclease activity A